MAKRLYSFPIDAEDEAESVSSMLNENNIEHYITPGSRWGFSRSTLWIKNNEDHERAKELFEQHVVTYAAKARKEYQEQTGYNPDAEPAEKIRFLLNHLWHRKLLVIIFLVVLYMMYHYLKLFFNLFGAAS